MKSNRLDLRSKLFLFSLLIDLVILVLVGLYLEQKLHDDLQHSIIQQLYHDTDVAISVLDRVLNEGDADQLSSWTKALGDAMHVRLTIIDQHGVVRGDSGVPRADISSLDSHLMRQEIQEAVENSKGIAQRYSTTMGEPMLYLARSFILFGSRWFVRVSISAREVHDAVDHQRKILISSGLLALLPGIAITALLANLLTRRLRNLARHARHTLEELLPDMRHPVARDDLDGLAWSIERMTISLESLFQELSDDRSRMDAVLSSMTEGVISLDTEHRIVLINDSAMRLLEISSPPPIGHAMETVLPPACLTHILAFQQFQGGCPMEEKTIVERHTHLQMSGARLKKDRGCVLVFRDITERHRTEMLQTEFVANASHELRTPAHAILIHAELLMERLAVPVSDEPACALARSLEKNAVRLSHIIDDVLYLTRLDAGKEVVALESVCLLDALVPILEDLDRLFVEKQMQVDVRVELHWHLLADTRMLGRVILNLLGNAVQHCPTHSRVQVAVRQDGPMLRVEIADNGPGIPPEHHSRLFDRFYRVDWDRSRKTGGTGLGLSIAQHLVKQMNGSIGVESVLPHGCLFWFTLCATHPDTQHP